MVRRTSHVLASLLVVSLFAAQSQARLPGTMNFTNVTTEKVNMTVGETGGNEKEVEVADFDNDGDLDVVIGNAQSDFGQRRNKLYRNDGGVFNEVSGSPIISGFSGTDVTRSAFFRDYDDDGWLDIIVVNDANTAGDGGRTKIYMNKQVGGQFDRFVDEGLARLGASTGGAACGAVSVDSDNDGDMDLYVGNYPGPSQDTMYTNDANGFFSSVTGSLVPADGDYTVDVASGDINGDGKIDLLISNWSTNYVYYNDNLEGGSDVGDYSYASSRQALGSSQANENAMEAGDFDGDGDLDIYWGNAAGTSDRILVNTGNDAANKAILTPLSDLPASVMNVDSRKATVADLNGDGRDDIFVMKEAGGSSRPTILRNTTVNGQISFIDWTPATAFPNGSTFMGWHAAAFDADGDDDVDLFLGANSGEHLFENIDSREMTEKEARFGGLINVLNRAPAAVEGEVAMVDSFNVGGVHSGDLVSMVVNSECGDLTLQVVNRFGKIVAMSDRGGIGVEEVLEISTGFRRLKVQIVLNESCNPKAGDVPYIFEILARD